MTRPAKRPTKARTWKAWAVESSVVGSLVHLTVTSPFNGERITVMPLFKSRADARRYCGGASGEERVEIRLVPATPRRRSR